MNELKANNPPRMRTIRQTAAELNLPEFFIRRLVAEDKIVYVKAGSKALVNVDRLVEYLNGGASV